MTHVGPGGGVPDLYLPPPKPNHQTDKTALKGGGIFTQKGRGGLIHSPISPPPPTLPANPLHHRTGKGEDGPSKGGAESYPRRPGGIRTSNCLLFPSPNHQTEKTALKGPTDLYQPPPPRTPNPRRGGGSYLRLGSPSYILGIGSPVPPFSRKWSHSLPSQRQLQCQRVGTSHSANSTRKFCWGQIADPNREARMLWEANFPRERETS